MQVFLVRDDELATHKRIRSAVSNRAESWVRQAGGPRRACGLGKNCNLRVGSGPSRALRTNAQGRATRRCPAWHERAMRATMMSSTFPRISPAEILEERLIRHGHQVDRNHPAYLKTYVAAPIIGHFGGISLAIEVGTDRIRTPQLAYQNTTATLPLPHDTASTWL